MTAPTADVIIRRRKITVTVVAVITFLTSEFPMYFLQFPSNYIYMGLQPILLTLKLLILFKTEPHFKWKQIYDSLTTLTTVPLTFSLFFVGYILQITDEQSRYLTPFGLRLYYTPFDELIISLTLTLISLFFCLVQNITYRDYCARYTKKKVRDILIKKREGPQEDEENWSTPIEVSGQNSRSGISFPDVWTEFDVHSFKEIIEIGKGGQGQVFRANSGRFGCVAVKVYNGGCEVNNREIESMQQFTHHPNIIRLFGYVQNLAIDNFQTNRIGYVMEYMENGSVHDAIYHWNPPYSYDTGLSWICQIGRGLSYLHDKNVIHRDVKPRNLLLCNDRKTVKLCDFGLARVFGDEAEMTVFVGTPKYMAPEMIRGRDQTYSAKVDVYSMAITAWEILARRDPFGHLSSKAASSFEISEGICNGERPVSSFINDSDMEAILKRAWSSNEEDRPSMEEITTFFEQKCPKPETELRRRATTAGDDSGYDETITAFDKTEAENEVPLIKKILISAGGTIAAAVPVVANYFGGED